PASSAATEEDKVVWTGVCGLVYREGPRLGRESRGEVDLAVTGRVSDSCATGAGDEIQGRASAPRRGHGDQRRRTFRHQADSPPTSDRLPHCLAPTAHN